MRIFERFYFSLAILSVLSFSCTKKAPDIQQWESHEMTFESTSNYQNPYTEVEFWVEFVHSNGSKITRPGFWDGGNSWKVRFASPYDSGLWEYTTYASNTEDTGLAGQTGALVCNPYQGNNDLIKHGLLKMSPGHRNVVHADGTPFLMVGDTPWALPWRGTYESVATYAKNRQERNFNTALLMSVQPDRDAEGPRSRTEAKGFAVAFEDLKDGHINEINSAYYQYLDSLMTILVDHGIVPVYQPVFHGFGWKGKNVLGWNVDPTEYARYCRYLVARFGAKPAMYLPGADSNGKNVGINEGGETFEKWDAYKQPTGLHYSPRFNEHEGKVNQEKDWLDFQWCQTNHGGIHQPDKVALMYENKPTKAVANGEPTYEGIRDSLNGAGWWQGEEAWLQYTSGGTMGVVYGAGGLWNWKLFPDEEGWAEWANSNVSWKEAIELPGSKYVGYVGKALAGFNTTDIEKHPELAEGKLCLAKPGELFVIYLPEGGSVKVRELPELAKIKWFDPVAGEFISSGVTNSNDSEFKSPITGPSVLIISE